MKLVSFLRTGLHTFIDLVYPRLCIGCGEVAIADSTLFCLDCHASLPYTNMEKLDENNEFEKHFAGRIPIHVGMAMFYYSKKGMIQNAIHKLKYGHLPCIGREMGRMLGKKIKKHPGFDSCDLVIPIPLHRKKLRRRGYNQAAEIARGVAEVLNIPMYEQIVIRKVYSHSQTKHSRLGRMKNMKNKFHIGQMDNLRDKHILLIDDILTTGATLDRCGEEILRIPGTQLSLATVAMGAMV